MLSAIISNMATMEGTSGTISHPPSLPSLYSAMNNKLLIQYPLESSEFTSFELQSDSAINFAPSLQKHSQLN